MMDINALSDQLHHELARRCWTYWLCCCLLLCRICTLHKEPWPQTNKTVNIIISLVGLSSRKKLLHVIWNNIIYCIEDFAAQICSGSRAQWCHRTKGLDILKVSVQCKSNQQMDGYGKELQRLSNIKNDLCLDYGEIKLFPTDLTQTGCEFHTVLVRQLRRQVLTFLLTMGMKDRSEPANWSCLGFLAGLSSECKYAGCFDERAV